MQIKNNTYIYIFTLLFIGFLTHISWFNFTTTLNFSDWYYWPDLPTKELYNSWGTWVTYWDLGQPNIQIYFLLFKSVWSLITQIGTSYDDAVKFTFLIPISIFGFLSPFFLSKHITKNNLVSFIGALFYGTTTYFLLKQTAHIPIAFVYAMTPIVFLLAIETFKKNKSLYWIILTLTFSIIVGYEIRIGLILATIIFIYFVLFHIRDYITYIKNILISLIVFITLNAYWLIPSTQTTLVEKSQTIANRGLFGNKLFDMKYAINLYESSWTGSYPNMEFKPQTINVFAWLIPISIVIILYLSTKKKNDNYKMLVFFSLISIIGILLTKQSSYPYKNLYSWLYDNVPIFNLYREASKFYLITALGYLGIITIGLNTIRKESKILFTLLTLSIIAISLLNLKPLLNQDIKTMFVNRTMPYDYQILTEYINSQNDYFRTLWIPRDSRWSPYSNYNPKASGLTATPEIMEYLHSDKSLILDSNKLNIFDNILDQYSIKYVIIPIKDDQNDDDFFQYYKPRDYYIDQINKFTCLKPLDIGTNDLLIYENENYRPHIYITDTKPNLSVKTEYEDIEYQLVSPTEYKVKISNINDSLYLNFSENYNPYWRLRIGEFNWVKSIISQNYFIDNTYHKKNEYDLNTYFIDIEQVCTNYTCTINENGSYDIEATLYFEPQTRFYLGVFVSLSTLVLIFVYTIYRISTHKRLS